MALAVSSLEEVFVRTTLRSRKPATSREHDAAISEHGHSHGNNEHKHSDSCGHVAVKHRDHWDYIVDGQLHHYDVEGDKCDVHGELDVGNLQSLLRSTTPTASEASASEDGQDGSMRRNWRLHQQASHSHGTPSPPALSPWYRDQDSLRFVTMMFLTGSFLVVELAVGVAIGSLVLQADAFHMLSDMVALAIGFYSLRSSKRAHSSTASFGYARFEVVGSLVNAVFLLATAFQIVLEVISRLASPEAQGGQAAGETAGTPNARLLMIVGGVGLGINLLGVLVFSTGHGHGHNHGEHGHGAPAAPPPPSRAGGHGHSHMSMNMQGVLLHVLGDALGSVAVLVVGAIMQYTTWPHKELADPLASLVIVIIIVVGTSSLLRSSSHILLEKVPLHVDLPALRSDLLAVPGVLSLHDLHVWEVSPGRTVGTLHLILDRKVRVAAVPGLASTVSPTDVSYRQVVDLVKGIMHKAGIHASTVQPEWVSATVQDKVEKAAAAFLAALARAKAKTGSALVSATPGASRGGSAPGSRAGSPGTVPDLIPVSLPGTGMCHGHSHDAPMVAVVGPASCCAEGGDQSTGAMLLSLDMCNELVCGEACVAASCCPQPQAHHTRHL